MLVWKADTATMNPRIDPAIIAEAYESDPEAARAEYGAEFRDDLADYITREAVDAVTCWGRSELPPEPWRDVCGLLRSEWRRQRCDDVSRCAFTRWRNLCP